MGEGKGGVHGTIGINGDFEYLINESSPVKLACFQCRSPLAFACFFLDFPPGPVFLSRVRERRVFVGEFGSCVLTRVSIIRIARV